MTTITFLGSNKIALSSLPVVNTVVSFPEAKTDRTCKHLAGIWEYLGTEEYGNSVAACFVKDGNHMSQQVDIFE